MSLNSRLAFQLLACFVVPFLVWGCGETEYDLFSRVNTLPGDGDGNLGDGDGSSTGGESGQGDGDGDQGGDGDLCTDPSCEEPVEGSGGMLGLGGALPGPSGKCASEVRPGLGLVQLQMQGSAECIVPGDETMLLDEPAYEVHVAPCDDAPEQYWTIFVDFELFWEFRNETTKMNLDIQFAGIADGTPAVLFDPHALFNQRFRATSDERAVRLRPRNTDQKCLTEVDGLIVLQPCDPQSVDQLIRVLPCMP